MKKNNMCLPQTLNNGVIKLPMNLQFHADAPAGDGGEGENNSTAAPETQQPETQPSQTDGKTFSQEQLNKMMAREKWEGRSEMLSMFGLPDNKDGIAQLRQIALAVNGLNFGVTNTTTNADAQAQVANVVNPEASQANTPEAAQANLAVQQQQAEMLTRAQIKAELALNQVKPEYVDDAMTLIKAQVNLLEHSEQDIADAVKEFKAKRSIFFGAGQQVVTSTGSTPSANGTATTTSSSGTSAQALGKRLAAINKSQK